MLYAYFVHIYTHTHTHLDCVGCTEHDQAREKNRMKKKEVKNEKLTVKLSVHHDKHIYPHFTWSFYRNFIPQTCKIEPRVYNASLIVYKYKSKIAPCTLPIHIPCSSANTWIYIFIHITAQSCIYRKRTHTTHMGAIVPGIQDIQMNMGINFCFLFFVLLSLFHSNIRIYIYIHIQHMYI